MIDFTTPRGHLADLVALTKSNEPSGAMAACPVPTGRLQLLPLRYGLVEKEGIPKPLPTPYELESHTAGLRLLRDGYLYVIDSTTNLLHEYLIEHGSLTALLCKAAVVTEDTRCACGEPLMIFADTSVLHVCYSEIQWTARKCAQVLDSLEDREHFMQRVNLAYSDEFNPGEHMFSAQQVKRGLAEIAWGKSPQPRPAAAQGPEEFSPYAWEHTPLFRHTWLEELTSQVDDTQRNAYLFLAVRDDLAVMRDLAAHQDRIVERMGVWMDGGETPGQNERDYLMGCYIESLSVITEDALEQLVNAVGDYRMKALLNHLKQQPEPEQSQLRTLILEYGKVADGTARPPAGGIGSNAAFFSINGFVDNLDKANCRHFFADAPQAFVERHIDALTLIGKHQNEQIRDVLEGPLVGQRGVNDFIDRAALDADMLRLRAPLNRWNLQLDSISRDRAILLCKAAFHHAAWYFDPYQIEQIHEAFVCQYGCLKDIGRSDDANHAILLALTHRPQWDIPLFHTLPLSDQTLLTTQIAGFINAGAVLLNNVEGANETLRSFTRGKLPWLSDLPPRTGVVGEDAHRVFDPAIGKGMAQALDPKHFPDGKIPSLDELFRQLPKVLPRRLLMAAYSSGVTFQVGAPEDVEALRSYMKQTLETRRALQKVTRARQQLLHKRVNPYSDAPQKLLREKNALRERLTHLENLLARGLSPLGDLPEGTAKFYGGQAGRPSITLVFPPAEAQELKGLLEGVRGGLRAAPITQKLGDGVATLFFFSQAMNLWQLYREYEALPNEERQWISLAPAIAATASAGFAVAQGIADTALKARSFQLAESLQQHALKGVQVQMGMLHVGLGMGTYFAGALSSAMSLGSHTGEWEQAVRSGNGGIMGGAALAVLGSGGQLVGYGHGLSRTVAAGYEVLVARDAAARATQWAVSGVKLSSVFTRVNVVVAVFSLLELAGIWIHNRYNLSRHDQWLQSTPWGRDPELKAKESPEGYWAALKNIVHSPTAVLGEHAEAPWWRKLLLIAGPGDIQLLVPGVKLEDLAAPLNGQASVRLGFCAYRYSKIIGFFKDTDYWHNYSDSLHAGLKLVEADPLVLQLSCPEYNEDLKETVGERLILIIRVEDSSPDNPLPPRDYYFNIDTQIPETYHPETVQLPPDKMPPKFIPIDEILFGGKVDGAH